MYQLFMHKDFIKYFKAQYKTPKMILEYAKR